MGRGEGTATRPIGAGAFFGGRRVTAGVDTWSRHFINQRRWARLQRGEVILSPNGEGVLPGDETPERMSVLEAVTWLAGDTWDDTHKYVAPVIAEFLFYWGRCMDEEERQKIVPLVPQVIGSALPDKGHGTHAWMAWDWLARTYAPVWLELARLDDCAEAMRELPELTLASLAVVRPVLDKVLDEATTVKVKTTRECDNAFNRWRMVEQTAGELMGRSACKAAGAAAELGVGEIDETGDRVQEISVYAAQTAVWAMVKALIQGAWSEPQAWSEVKHRLEPTVGHLQESAFNLLDRMSGVGGARRQ